MELAPASEEMLLLVQVAGAPAGDSTGGMVAPTLKP